MENGPTRLLIGRQSSPPGRFDCPAVLDGARGLSTGFKIRVRRPEEGREWQDGRSDWIQTLNPGGD